MFEAITDSIRGALSLIDRGRLTDANIRDGLRQVRQALLEADVNYEVAQQFITRVTEQAVGEQVLKSLKPSEQIVGIVYNELVNLMGPVDHSLHIKRDGISILMMCGLQGSGKTTTCGKLARMLKEQGVQPMLVAADLQRPAAIDQLKIIGEQIGVPVYSEDPAKSSPLQVCRNAVNEAKRTGNVKVIILDTAGRLHVDDELMRELELIDTKIVPDQALLVCDSMTGQDAVNSAKAFNEALELDGVILTKLDGDTRGGAALSVKAVTGVPIKFIGVGEQLDRLEEFHPGPDGQPHPRRRRPGHAAGKGPARVRRRRNGPPAGTDAEGPVHAGGVPGPVQADQKARFDEADPGHDPRIGRPAGLPIPTSIRSRNSRASKP